MSRDNQQPLPERDEWLAFEDLLLELSARFINVTPEKLDDEILEAQRRMCECLGLDRSSLWQRPKGDSDEATMTHRHGSFGPPLPEFPMRSRTFFPWIFERVFGDGQVLAIPSLSELPPEASRDAETLRHYGTEATVIVPLAVAGEPVRGAITFASRTKREWPEVLLKRFRVIAHVFANAFARRDSELELKKSLEELRLLREQLEQENIYLKEQVKKEAGLESIVGESPAIMKTLSQARKVASVSSTVLVFGETGTGKELIAQAIHDMSPRSHRPLVKVNCAGFPSTLIENELFGREKGAYTGAMTKYAGRFETANNSTLFLDEISELSMDLQVKLLRVLQEGEFERLGGSQTLKVDVRIIAATNRDLSRMVEQGRFRSDLYFRLNVFPIEVPPLRERTSDIPRLAWFFVRDFSKRMGKPVESIPKIDLEQLKKYPWPGNVRELRNLVERAMILSEGPVLRITLPVTSIPASEQTGTLEEIEARHISEVLDRTGWRISGKNGAAELLGMVPTTLHSRMKKLGIVRPTSRKSV